MNTTFQPVWSKNYSASHNVHFDFPPVMSDGRNFAGWQPGNAINAAIRQNENIKSNWDYRRYLTHNAERVMEMNRIDAVNESGHGSFDVSSYENEQRNTPFMYSSVMDKREPYGYTSSDLKNLYLSRQELQSRMIAPEITQAQLFTNAQQR